MQTDFINKCTDMIEYRLINPEDDEHIKLIAGWYFNEWNIPVPASTEKIKKLSPANHEFQLLMTINNEPVATGGLYTHVGLLDREPRFKIYEHWLALIYTKPENRGKGLGTDICKNIQDRSKTLGLKNLYLFTHTAESLYIRLGWQQLERITVNGKNIVVMKKEL